jgi:hypothetical protein
VKLSGTIEFVDLELGIWVLRADDGTRYELAGGDRGIKKPGRRVEVEGEVDRAAITAAMVGPVLHVRRYELLD